MPELLPSNTNHPSILAFQNNSHIPFPSSEWWLPCVIKYSTSQQRFIKKEVHEFLKLFCKSLWELTMKANTSAGVQLPSYPGVQPDTGICGSLPLWCVRNPLLSGVWEHCPHSQHRTQPTLWELLRHSGQFCQEEMVWGLPDGMCLSMQQLWEARGANLLPGIPQTPSRQFDVYLFCSTDDYSSSWKDTGGWVSFCL